MPGKRVQFDDETWQSLDLIKGNRLPNWQTKRDLLKKHVRPVNAVRAQPLKIIPCPGHLKHPSVGRYF